MTGAGLSAERVLEESAAWIWVPEDARTTDTGEAFVIAYPEHFSEPTVALRFESERPADLVIADVMRAARDLGRDAVNFFEISDTTTPPDLERRLQELGASLTERLAVLALDLTGGLPDLAVPGDLEVRPVASLEDMRAVDRIDTEVFGGTSQDDAALAASLERGGADGRSVAWRGGAPLGTAGHVLADGTLRLWGGACLAEARHAGVYRALLDHRLRVGLDAGATMALVKGRVDTSAPVLLRSGFQQYGEVRAYRLEQEAVV